MPAALGVGAPPGLVQLMLWSRGSVLRRPSLGRRGQHPAPAEWFSSRRRPAGRVEERLHLPTGSGSAVLPAATAGDSFPWGTSRLLS